MATRLPDFVIIGAQKAGTTWLGARLAEQPGLFLPRPFEVHYFDRDERYSKGREWYAAHFAAAPEGALIGEKTPDYFWTLRPEGRGPADIPERMRDTLPNARLVVVLRDPVKRAISALNHFVRNRWLSPFVNPDAVLADALDAGHDRYGMIGCGHYLVHLRRFLQCYQRERIHIIFFEDDLIKAPQTTLDGVLAFLGCPSAQRITARSRPENSRMNSKLGLVLNYYAPRLSALVSVVDRILLKAPPLEPSPACRALLYDHFDPHNRALFDFLGRDTGAWNGTGASQRRAL